jgi:parallel beta-helix repeat protein
VTVRTTYQLVATITTHAEMGSRMSCAKCGGALEPVARYCGECWTSITVATPSPILVPPATAPDPVRQSVTPPSAARQPSLPPPVGDAIARLRAVRNRGARERLAPADATQAIPDHPSEPARPPVPERVPDTAAFAIATPPHLAVPPVLAPDPAQQWVEPCPLVTTPPPTVVVPGSRRGLFLRIGAAVVAGGAGVAYLGLRPGSLIVDGPGRLVVDASGSGDYKTIASAILGAKPGEIIVRRPGTYKETLVFNNDVRITGEGGRSKVIVEGAPTANVFDFLSGSATLTGMAIRIVGTVPAIPGWGAIAVRAGTPVIEDYDLTSSAGAAVFIHGAGANPVIRNCTMRNSSGGGVFVLEQGHGTIEKCVISGNAMAGVAISRGGNPTVRDCQIRDHRQAGVYVFDQGQGTIEKCVISGNTIDGVRISKGGNSVVRDCQIRDNRQVGVLVLEQGQGTIEKCVISGNGISGVETKQGWNPTVRDCEIRDGQGAGVWVYEQGQGTFTGNTLTGNALGTWVIAATAGTVTRTGNRPNA